MNQAWMTRQEAADYLRVSCDTIDRRLCPMEGGPMEGKLRYRLLQNMGIRRVRILATDVYGALPQPETEAA